jgi:stress response protein YsnF
VSRSNERESATIPVVEERLTVAKRETVTGVVRLTKHVHEEEQVVDEPLESVEIDVERVKLDRWVDGPVAVRQEGDTTIYPVLEEVAVIETRLKLVEEVRVTRRQVARRASDRIPVRREEITVERIDAVHQADEDCT